MQSFHLRGDLDEAAAAVTRHLGAEGYTITENHDAHDPSVRRIALYAERGWVGLAEDPFAPADWGSVLSDLLETQVITLAGECDHAFYTHVFIHERGEEKHAARVPEDVTLDDDGLHRLRAAFLGPPLVVDELGGEPNMERIGERLGVPRPRFHADDEPSRVLYFAYTSDAPAEASDFAKLFALGGLKFEPAPEMRAVFGIPTAKTDGPPRLVPSHTTTSSECFAGQKGHVFASFLLEDASATGVNVSVYGDGLALFETAQLVAQVADREWTLTPVVKDGLVTFALPNVELAQPPARPDTSRLPLEERLRRGMKRRVDFRSNPAELKMWFQGRFLEPGEGELAITAQLVGHERSAATSELVLKVNPAMRTPLLPASAPPPHPAHVESYEARDMAFGWVAFDAPWTTVRETVLQIAKEAEQVLREATASANVEATAALRTGKRLTFKKNIWPKLDEALSGGADASVSIGKFLEGAAIDVVHQVDGPNLLPDLKWQTQARPPRVWLAWWCPRPASDAGARALALLAERALGLASKQPSHLGGLASAQRERSLGHFDTAYDTLADLRRVNDAAWLRTHPRGPGWRVLLPPGVPARERVLKSAAPDPFSYADAEAMERLILPLLA